MKGHEGTRGFGFGVFVASGLLYRLSPARTDPDKL